MNNNRILHVEDNPDDAEIVILELEKNDFMVAWQRVENRPEFELALTADIDVIVADYTLPDFSASDALATLQTWELDIPFIVVTGSISEEVAVACIKQGADDYLLKDRLSRLGNATRNALQQRDLRRAKRDAERDLQIADWAIRSSINAIALADLSGDITRTNQAFLDLWGFEDHAQVAGKPLHSLWQSAEIGRNLMQALHTSGSLRGEMLSLRCNDEAIVLQFSASLVTGVDDQPICVMGIFSDVTEQKRADEARKENEILRVALDKEQALRELKSRFMSMFVHDFRTPLSTIQLMLYLLQEEGTHVDEAARQKRIALAIESLDRLDNLAEEVLALSQTDHSQFSFKQVEMDLTGLCQSVVDLFAHQTDAKHDIQFRSPNTPVSVQGDPNLMHRALSNLLSNAIKYSPQGGQVCLSLEAHPQEITLSVADSGIGIPEKDLAHLFEPFQRATNVGRLEGTGLGLTIVKQIVELHGGQIECESVVNRGTTFTIHFPANTAPQA